MEDDSDLIYEKEVKVLLQDHRTISRFLMTFGIFVLILQTVFAFWCLYQLNPSKNNETGLLIIWYHILKLLHNAYMI